MVNNIESIYKATMFLLLFVNYILFEVTLFIVSVADGYRDTDSIWRARRGLLQLCTSHRTNRQGMALT